MIDQTQRQLPLPQRLIEHREAVAVLAKAGIAPPSAWRKMDARLSDYIALESPVVDRLIGSIVNPSASDDRATMGALALSEVSATHANVAALTHTVVDAILAKLQAIYADAAQDNYSKAGAQFNATATAFSSAASVVDCETSAVQMVNRPEVERTAWTQAEALAARLTTLLPVLATAASLAGLDGIDPDVPDDTILLPLVVDTTGLHRRRLWECWTTKDGDGRTGTWGALAALGATIRALPNLKDHEPYAPPRAVEYRDETILDQHGHATLTKRVPFDPEDQLSPPAIDPKREPGRFRTA